jgi:hypothetical protein
VWVATLRNVLRWTRRNGEFDRGRLCLVGVLPIMIVFGALGALTPPLGGDRLAPAVIAILATAAATWVIAVANKRP